MEGLTCGEGGGGGWGVDMFGYFEGGREKGKKEGRGRRRRNIRK